MAKKVEGATATVEQTEVKTADRIVDAATQHVMATRIQNEFKLLAKVAGKLAEGIYVHQAGAVGAMSLGQQTMLFENVKKATLQTECQTLEALEAALLAAHKHYDPADYED
jgi:hypothetical protein